jgi:hypothetical protein
MLKELSDSSEHEIRDVYLVQELVLSIVDRLCRLVVRVPGCRTEMYCVSCEVRTEFIYVI